MEAFQRTGVKQKPEDSADRFDENTNKTVIRQLAEKIDGTSWSISNAIQGDQGSNVGILMVGPVRNLNEESGLYTHCLVNAVKIALLADTGANVCIISKRRYEALGHRKPKVNAVDSQRIIASSNKIET
ncbi:hypothetical protein CHS0354_037841 [Potamilus streckersoni]|uniref:Uncharacterized protein n=1 Tax=Potamilus streckersoni TaxID=2493646 RepID=A0AAE0VW02_9BIVA|nr:hypothetical protein CHS0354_037841 [Potamilus streckersoni]